MWFIYITLLSGRERQRNVPKCKTHERAEKLEHVERAQRKKSTAHAKRTARAKRAQHKDPVPFSHQTRSRLLGECNSTIFLSRHFHRPINF